MDERRCIQFGANDANNEGSGGLEALRDSIPGHDRNLSRRMGQSFKCHHNLGHFQNARVEMLVGKR